MDMLMASIGGPPGATRSAARGRLERPNSDEISMEELLAMLTPYILRSTYVHIKPSNETLVSLKYPYELFMELP